MIFCPVMQFNGRYEKPSENRPRCDATNTQSLRESVNLYADIPVIPLLFDVFIIARVVSKKNATGHALSVRRYTSRKFLSKCRARGTDREIDRSRASSRLLDRAREGCYETRNAYVDFLAITSRTFKRMQTQPSTYSSKQSVMHFHG